MNRIKKKIFYIVMFTAIILTIVFGLFFSNRTLKYGEYKINIISKYLSVNSIYYEGIQGKIKELGNDIKINDIDDIELNKQIASYVINNVVSNNQYGYDDCKKCYKYFSVRDNVKFYDVDVIEKIYNEMFNGKFKRISQEDVAGFNIIYYNEDIDKYYINVVSMNELLKNISVFKGYGYENMMLYLDYYYLGIGYDDFEDLNNKEENEKIYLYDVNDIMVKELMYDDLFNEDNVPSKYNDYIEYFDVIRYVFKYDKTNKMYVLDSMKLL